MRWEIREVDETLVDQLTRELGIDRLVAKLLVLRGIKTAEEAKEFLVSNKKNFTFTISNERHGQSY